MRVLIGCECSGIVRDAFIARGHDAWSCDLKPTERPGPHIEGDLLKALNGGGGKWDLLIAHPMCTYLTNAGVRHLYDHITSVNGKRAMVNGVARWKAMHEAAEFFNLVKESDIERICVENPIPHRYARNIIGRYSQLIQPWQFGHGETKATCLWLKNLPLLVPTNIVPGREARIHKMSPGPDRAANRSRTFQGIADAMADQWGGVLAGV